LEPATTDRAKTKEWADQRMSESLPKQARVFAPRGRVFGAEAHRRPGLRGVPFGLIIRTLPGRLGVFTPAARSDNPPTS